MNTFNDFSISYNRSSKSYDLKNANSELIESYASKEEALTWAEFYQTEKDNSVTVEAFAQTLIEKSENKKLDLALVQSVDDLPKKEAQIKNTVNRLRTIAKYDRASNAALMLIAELATDQQVFNQLSDHSNYKTSERVLDCAHMLSASNKYSSIIDYVLAVLKRAKSQDLTVDQICSQSTQCYARVSNALKALYFFGLVELSSAQTNKNFILKMSKDSRVSFNADKLKLLSAR